MGNRRNNNNNNSQRYNLRQNRNNNGGYQHNNGYQNNRGGYQNDGGYNNYNNNGGYNNSTNNGSYNNSNSGFNNNNPDNRTPHNPNKRYAQSQTPPASTASQSSSRTNHPGEKLKSEILLGDFGSYLPTKTDLRLLKDTVCKPPKKCFT